VDLGGKVEDVFVNHKVYGKLKADLAIGSRRDVEELIEGIQNGKSSPLLNVTSGYHYHTVTAKSEKILNLVEKTLREKEYLVQ
jgi:transcriptional regulator of NAD metabolism